MAKRPSRPKRIAYELIPDTSDVGQPMYELLYSLVDAHHEDLSQANVRIALAWSLSWKPDVDGRLTLGKCKKATDLDRELAPFDFVVLINREFWQHPRVTDTQRRALLDHELMHAAIAYDENGDPKVDSRGRQVYRIRKHTIEEFTEIVDRYGCYKNDLEAFARAVKRAEAQTGGVWIGYAALRETLARIGVDVSLETVRAWNEAERKEVLTWALVRQDLDERVNTRTSQTLPACLAAAMRPATDTSDGAAGATAH